MKVGKMLLAGFVGLVLIVGASGNYGSSKSEKSNTSTSASTNTASKPSATEVKQAKLLAEATTAVEVVEKDTTQENIDKARQAIIILKDSDDKTNLSSRVDVAIKKRDDELAAKAKAEAEAKAKQTAQKPAPQPEQPTVSCPRNCTEARAMGMTNIPRGHVCYKKNLDRDGDGIGCDK